MLVLLLIINIIMNIVMVCSVYWFSSWVMVELTGFIFMMILSDSEFTSSSKKVAMWKYYLYQSIGSIMFVICMFMKVGQVTYSWGAITNAMILMSLSMKLGLPPFHKWSFEVSENLDWMKFLLINSVQKTPSLILVWKLTDMSWPMMVSSSWMLLFSLMGLFDWSLRRFLLYSSILNYVWILLCSALDSMSMILYLMVYLWTLTAVTVMFSKFSFSCFSFMFNNNTLLSLGPLLNIILSVNMMSMSGMPPLAGFIAKYDLLVCLIFNLLIFLSILLMVASMILLLMYLILTVSSAITNKIPSNWLSMKDFYMIIICLMNLVMPLMYLM